MEAGDLAAVGVEPAANDGREAAGADLAVQLLQVPLQVVHGPAVAGGVDAGEVQEGAAAVDAGQPPQVGVVGRLAIITGRPVGGPGGVVDQVPAVVVVGEAKVGVAGQHLGDDRGQAGTAYDHQVVAVQVDQAGRSDDLVVGVEAEAAG